MVFLVSQPMGQPPLVAPKQEMVQIDKFKLFGLWGVGGKGGETRVWDMPCYTCMPQREDKEVSKRVNK